MTKTLILTAVLLGGVALPTLTMAEVPTAPAGAEATGCDMDKFTPILGAKGNVLYWNNPTCPDRSNDGISDDTPVPVVVEDPVEEPGDETPVEEVPAEA